MRAGCEKHPGARPFAESLLTVIITTHPRAQVKRDKCGDTSDAGSDSGVIASCEFSILDRIKAVLEDKTLEPSERVVLVRLMLSAGECGETTWKHETIAERIGISSRHSKRIIKALHAKGQLRVVQMGLRKANRHLMPWHSQFSDVTPTSLISLPEVKSVSPIEPIKGDTQVTSRSDTHDTSVVTPMALPIGEDSGSEEALSEESSDLRPRDGGLVVVSPDYKTRIEPSHIKHWQRERFVEWWAVYWRKVAKQPAQKAFTRQVRSPERFEQVMNATRMQTPLMMSRSPDKRPHGATWLNDSRWDDEIDEELKQPQLAHHPQLLSTKDEQIAQWREQLEVV
jgi:hypothetical protein